MALQQAVLQLHWVTLAEELSSHGRQNENLRLPPFKSTTDSYGVNDPDDLTRDVPQTPAASSASHQYGEECVDQLQLLSWRTGIESLHAFNWISYDIDIPWRWSHFSSAKSPRSSELSPNRL